MSEVVQLAEHRKWTDQFNVSETGKALPNLRNVLVALRNDPSLRSSVKFDEMAREVMFNGEPLTDVAVTGVQEYLQLLYLPRISSETVHQALAKYASECSFHPVRDYLNGLVWDGQWRLETWLSTYCGAEATPYTAGVGKAFLIGAVARIFEPGCKMDYLPILEGEQGAGKSTAVSILGGKWFTDSLPEIGKNDKDLSLRLRGHWFIEVGELSAMRKAESEALKSFISRTVEVYRPPFARLDVREPRQAVLVGTTNQTQYLRDETGARRYWPVRVGQIDTVALERDRDQLFAEAVAYYRCGEQWWPDAELALLARAEANLRHEEDAWQPAIELFLESKDRTTVSELLSTALLMSTASITPTDQRRVAAILRRMGWVQRRTGKARYYVHEEDKAAAK